MALLDRLAVKLFQSRRTQKAGHRLLARQVHPAAKQVHFYYFPNRISFTQIHPFIRYRDALFERFGVGLRAFSIIPHLNGAAPHSGAEHILVQPWFTAKDDELERLMQALSKANPDATIDFIDGAAPNDLRLGRAVSPYIRYYLKKSLFKDRSQYHAEWLGDTNLADYVTRQFGGNAPPNPYKPPIDLIPKLRTSPNFFTSPLFFDMFLEHQAPPDGRRHIDVHARMAIEGGAREKLRQIALERLQSVPGQHLQSEARLPWAAYLDEMRQSKVCFSPFGYGELCWRDIEAFAAGAVLIKPDMDHLETHPDLYIPDETYLPVAWDCADLPQVMERALNDAPLRRHLAENAWVTIHDYLKNDTFLNDIAYLWSTTPESEP